MHQGASKNSAMNRTTDFSAKVQVGPS